VADLKTRTHSATTLMNVKVPATLFESIGKLATRLGASKTEVVTALLNEGLGVAATKWPQRRLPK